MEVIMTRISLAAAIAFLGLTGSLPTMTASAEVLQSVTTFVRGEIVQIQGPYYTIRDDSGRELKLHVDGTTTKADENFQVGDRVAADVTPKGHVGLMVKQPGAR
jgi:hypothetical protein